MPQSGLAKWIRVISYSLAGILSALLIVNILLSSSLQNKLRTKLEKVTDADIKFKSVHANIFTLSLSLQDVDISYFGKGGKERFHKFKVEETDIRGINPIKWLKDELLSANKIILKNGTLHFDAVLLNSKDTVPWPLTVKANAIELINTNFKIHDLDTAQVECTGDIHLRKFNSLEPAEITGLRCRLHHITYSIPESFQVIRVKGLTADSENGNASLDSVGIGSSYTKKEYGRKLGYQSDYIEATAEAVSLTGFNILALLKNKFAVQNIQINNPRLYAYRDRNVQPRNDRKKMPHEMLAETETDICIDTLAVNNAEVFYEERPIELRDTTGVISFSETNSMTYHIYNHPSKGEDQTMTTISRSKLSGKGTVDVKFVFPLVSGKDYHAEGIIKNLDLTSINTSSVNLGHIRINSGRLNSLAFDFSFNKEKASGKVVADYNDLRIDQLKLTKKGELKTAKFKTMVEKAIIIPLNKDSSMPVKQRTGEIDNPRDPTKFVWNYMLKSLLTGIRSSFNMGFLLPG